MVPEKSAGIRGILVVPKHKKDKNAVKIIFFSLNYLVRAYISSDKIESVFLDKGEGASGGVSYFAIFSINLY